MLEGIMTLLGRLNSYLYVPYQFLQVVGYRLVGKRCVYQWGKCGVKPVEPVTRKQYLLGVLFPVAVFWTILIFQAILHAYLYYRYYPTAFWIPIIFGLLPAIALGPYFHLVVLDMLRVRRLLKNKLDTPTIV
jgi:hypothetical protein